MKVAVVGNSARALGAVCAADFALSGHEVRYTVLAGQSDNVLEVRHVGGFTVVSGAEHLLAKQTGLARLDAVCDSVAEALAGAEAVFVDVDTAQLEQSFHTMIPHLAPRAVVHVQSHGYLPAARLTPLLARAGRVDVMVTEAPVPTHAARLKGTRVVPINLRSGVKIATMPAARCQEALSVLRQLIPDLSVASSVLQTGLENLNLIVHPALLLPNIGAFERAGIGGTAFGCYQEGVVPSVGMLGDAFDAERKRVCDVYGVAYTPMPKAIEQYYGYHSDSFYDAMRNPTYRAFPQFPSDIWRKWSLDDLPFAVVPCVELGEQAGVAMPLYRAFAEILGVLLDIDPWTYGPSLAEMNLDGTPESVTKRVLGAR